MPNPDKEKKRAAAIMIQGTSSHVGKSVLVAGLCRLFSGMGLSVAPFKAQNMALNSYVTLEGAEIGRAQAFQAEAAGIEPTAEMNPVLLKPTGDSVSQVIIEGAVHSAMTAREFHAFKPIARASVVKCFKRLEKEYDIIVIEGAGSPAEVNLREGDIANMGMAEIADCPVLLVGDIDRGGVFASLVGTLALLTGEETDRIKGFIINKFRGDVTLLTPGLEDLFDRTGKETLGVLPFIKDIRLPDEDSVALEEKKSKTGKKDENEIIIKIIKLPRISNFTDFDAFAGSPGTSLDFIDDPTEIDGADLVILPGSKNTLSDMGWIKESGFGKKIKDFSAGKGRVVGICGGLQMLGRSILDPDRIESTRGSIEGLGLLDITTTILSEKATYRVEAVASNPFYPNNADSREFSLNGYEVHMGRSVPTAYAGSGYGPKSPCRPFARITRRNKEATEVFDGAVSLDGSVWGSYIHGLFDSDAFRASIIESLREVRGLPETLTTAFASQKEEAYDQLADMLRENLDMESILTIMGLKEGVGIEDETGENRLLPLSCKDKTQG